MRIYLLHHADAVGPHVDSRRPLSGLGIAQAASLAAQAKTAGCVPDVIWHSGKLRARETAEAFYRACNPFADFKMVRGLLPDDPPGIACDLVTGDTRSLLLAGHMPNLRDVLCALTKVPAAEFPLHGLVALDFDETSGRWSEAWRAQPE